jgi:type IV fimbrial biogenesis protein FimT
MEPRHASGFTLVELVITVSVLALLASFALPGFTAIMQNNAMTASANELITAFTLARSEALKRESPVTICWTDSANADAPDCGDGNGWHSGWLIFADEDADGAFDDDEDVIRRQVGLAGRNITIQVRTTAAPLDTALTYLPTGFPNFTTTRPGGRNMLFCDQRADDDVARVINMSQTGRPAVRIARDVGGLEMSCEG